MPRRRGPSVRSRKRSVNGPASARRPVRRTSSKSAGLRKCWAWPKRSRRGESRCSPRAVSRGSLGRGLRPASSAAVAGAEDMTGEKTARRWGLVSQALAAVAAAIGEDFAASPGLVARAKAAAAGAGQFGRAIGRFHRSGSLRPGISPGQRGHNTLAAGGCQEQADYKNGGCLEGVPTLLAELLGQPGHQPAFQPLQPGGRNLPQRPD